MSENTESSGMLNYNTGDINTLLGKVKAAEGENLMSYTSSGAEQTTTESYINDLIKNYLTTHIPSHVGQIIITTVTKLDGSPKTPKELGYDGTWEQYSKGRFLIGAGTGVDDNNEYMTFDIDCEGGEFVHKLTVSEMPSHNHSGTMWYDGVSDGRRISNMGLAGGSSAQGLVVGGPGHMLIPTSNGGSNSHNNMPPYVVVYMWKRTA